MKKIIAIILLCVLMECADTKKETIAVFHAGSLSALFKECKVEFEKRHNYTVLLEASGSVDAARKLTDLHKPCDVIALADVELFDSMLKQYCPYWIAFAGNEMVLAYNKKSQYAKAIAANWIDALTTYNITCTRSDPLRDPCGYRTLLVWKLASQFYNNSKLEKIFAARAPIEYMRPKEIDCIALLETGACDAMWIYKSVAVEQNFPYITLDEHINLGNHTYEQLYRKTCIALSDTKKQYTFCGSTITYGVSIPVTANNVKGAIAFMSFLFSKEGQQLIQEYGFTFIEPYSNNHEQLSVELKKVIAGDKRK
ncbi:MAG: substrate-binding domain-containing protein [Spirochaetota bacterium]